MARGKIVAAANEYLANHSELIAEAKETVLRWHAEGVFGPRGGIRLARIVQHLTLMHRKRRPDL